VIRRSHARHAFTLIEMLLVLVLIVILLALALPAMKGPLASQRLRKSADLLRAKWSATRVKAMRTGRIQAFRFQLDGDRYLVQPWILSDDSLEANDADESAEMPAFAVDEEQLPEGVFFSVEDLLDDARAESLRQREPAGEPLPDTALADFDAGSRPWSRPILFYPDGTTSTAEVTLMNDRRRAVTVQLRGLTGIARVGELRKIEDRSDEEGTLR